jgi:hypothetical protein
MKVNELLRGTMSIIYFNSCLDPLRDFMTCINNRQGRFVRGTPSAFPTKLSTVAASMLDNAH